LRTERPHTFDRLSAFEEWLAKGTGPTAAQSARTAAGSGGPKEQIPQKPQLSKNKRDQIEREVAELEKRIAAVEAEISELELYFQNPTIARDWETTASPLCRAER
jgi:hypothetical protein